MSDVPASDVTKLLKEWSAGEAGSLDRLVPVVYEHLHRIAGRFMRAEHPDNSLQATALVNEAYLRLVDVTGVSWQDRAHFFAVSAQMMRRILVDAARARRSEKRGGAFVKIELHESMDELPARTDDLVALDEALSALAAFDERKARVVEMKFFAGLSTEETAVVLKVSSRSVERDWTFARAWLMRELAH
jgi:RNA polymerase sigma factor (TIGR02999 family)